LATPVVIMAAPTTGTSILGSYRRGCIAKRRGAIAAWSQASATRSTTPEQVMVAIDHGECRRRFGD
jgi:hypothetical protein